MIVHYIEYATLGMHRWIDWDIRKLNTFNSSSALLEKLMNLLIFSSGVLLHTANADPSPIVNFIDIIYKMNGANNPPFYPLM